MQHHRCPHSVLLALGGEGRQQPLCSTFQCKALPSQESETGSPSLRAVKSVRREMGYGQGGGERGREGGWRASGWK